VQQRPLLAVHVWSGHDTRVDKPGHPSAEDREEHERRFAEALAGFTEKYPDVPVTERLVAGRVVESLVEAVADADQLVVGSRQHRALARYFGSVSRSVVEHAPCTVTVARPVTEIAQAEPERTHQEDPS
jgi:nucleotide-binding universal stress UspA family protein